jgi:hypothetical protein
MEWLPDHHHCLNITPRHTDNNFILPNPSIHPFIHPHWPYIMKL